MKRLRGILLLLLYTVNVFSQENPIIKSLEKSLKKNNREDTARINNLNNLGWEYSFVDFETSSDYCRQAMFLSNKLDYNEGKAEAYNVLGNNARAKNHLDSAHYFLNNALRIRKKQDKPEKITAVLINIANIYHQQKDFAEAVVKYNEAIKRAETIHFEKGQLVALTNLADAYRSAGLPKKALEALNKALQLNRLMKDSSQEPYLYSTMAILLQEMNDFDGAIQNNKKALKSLENHPDVYLKASVLHNIGTYYRDTGKYDSALVFLKKAIIMEEQNADTSGLAITNSGISLVYARQEQPDLSIAFAERAGKLSLAISDTVTYYNSTLIIADAYKLKRDFKKALEYANRAAPLVTLINNKKHLYEMFDTYAGIYKGFNNHEKRADYLEKIIQYRDSVLSDENKQLSARMNVELDLYGKEKEIELLNKSAELSEVELSKQKSARNFITGIAVLFGLVVLVIIFFYVKIRKSNLVINKQRERVEAQNEIISKQKHFVEEKQKEVMDSIHYAKRIQKSLLPTEKYIERNINQLKKNT